jgi:hypothetical protein
MRGTLLLCLWLLPALAHAGSITITFGGTARTLTTTAAQDAKLTRIVTRENTQRTTRIPPQAAITVEDYVFALLQNDLRLQSEQADSYEKGDFCTVFPTLTNAQKTSIISLGGGSSPCP